MTNNFQEYIDGLDLDNEQKTALIRYATAIENSIALDYSSKLAEANATIADLRAEILTLKRDYEKGVAQNFGATEYAPPILQVIHYE